MQKSIASFCCCRLKSKMTLLNPHSPGLIFSLLNLLCFGSALKRVPLTKCCAANERYQIGYDNCKDIADYNSSFDIFQSKVSVIIYGVNGSVNLEQDSSQFQLTFNLSNCPKGYYHQIFTNFSIFGNGSIVIPQPNSILLLDHGSFCIDDIKTFDPIESLKSVARLCLPSNFEKPIFRKCCPDGMILHIDDGDDVVNCRLMENTFALNIFESIFPSEIIFDNRSRHHSTDNSSDILNYKIHSDAFPAIP